MRHSAFTVIITIAVLMGFASSATAQEDTYYQQHVHYTIKVDLDANKHVLKGAETLAYTIYERRREAD